MPLETISASFKVAIGRESHWCECESWDGGDRFLTREPVAMAKVGRSGSKLWPSKVWWFRQKDGSYRQSLASVHLNRQASIVGWNNAQTARYRSQHNSADPRVAPAI
jgi:hypothetical protein